MGTEVDFEGLVEGQLPADLPEDVRAQHERVQEQKQLELADVTEADRAWLDYCAKEGITRPFSVYVERNYVGDEPVDDAVGLMYLELE